MKGIHQIDRPGTISRAGSHCADWVHRIVRGLLLRPISELRLWISEGLPQA